MLGSGLVVPYVAPEGKGVMKSIDRYDLDSDESSKITGPFEKEYKAALRPIRKPSESDEFIVGKLNENNTIDISMLYGSAFKSSANMIIDNSGTLEEAKDIYQDAVMILLEQVKTGEFKLKCTLKTYMYSICRHLWLKKLRHKKNVLKKIHDLHQDKIECYTTCEYDEGQESYAKAKELLEKMSESCRKLLEAFYYDLKSFDLTSF